MHDNVHMRIQRRGGNERRGEGGERDEFPLPFHILGWEFDNLSALCVFLQVLEHLS